MCDFDEETIAAPKVIAPSASNTSDLDTEVSGIDPPVLGGLTQSMAIVVCEQTILYLGYSENSNHYLTKVSSLNSNNHIVCLHFMNISSIVSS